MALPANTGQPPGKACALCERAELMGGAVRCMSCGRWVPRTDRARPGTVGTRDRRGLLRVPDPPCPVCRPEEQRPRVTIRLPHRVFFKCDHCQSVWSIEVPR